MNAPPSRPRYTWPKYLLAAVCLFFLIAVVWTWKEVRRIKRIQREPRAAPPAALQTNSGQAPTNSTR